jgi:hypothetical protein
VNADQDGLLLSVRLNKGESFPVSEAMVHLSRFAETIGLSPKLTVFEVETDEGTLITFRAGLRS